MVDLPPVRCVSRALAGAGVTLEDCSRDVAFGLAHMWQTAGERHRLQFRR